METRQERRTHTHPGYRTKTRYLISFTLPYSKGTNTIQYFMRHNNRLNRISERNDLSTSFVGTTLSGVPNLHTHERFIPTRDSWYPQEVLLCPSSEILDSRRRPVPFSISESGGWCSFTLLCFLESLDPSPKKGSTLHQRRGQTESPFIQDRLWN